ncbi:DUF599 domain-containing protein [Prosthecodimorpha staleyi]|uniref:DUF599 family protein n=1 Tax=Prosthecodimorpha staleyi TaxID=2840188 RepID=A0A947DA70_9HYPH|nr:DUF599 family protein [Prosthecodimorpha staleyi]MBT9293199.1 DUF599 family protein [Prosthecodimorpha staleyi]
MLTFTLLDLSAFLWFVLCWVGYGWLTDRSRFGQATLNRQMNEHRRRWMAQMLRRDVRIIDTQIMASLQNGTAFFASTSLIAIGAAFTLLGQTERLIEVFGDLPLNSATNRSDIELKVLFLCAIYGYAFFKFGWAYRVFNYAAILIGAVPSVSENDPGAELAARRAADMQIIAASHFNLGLRAFFFSIGFLGWFVNAWIFMASTTFILAVLLRRQFSSSARVIAGLEADQGAGNQSSDRPASL